MTRDAYRAVLARAGGACQCTGTAPDGCGQPHPTRDAAPRCGAAPRNRRLALAPADPHVPDHQAVRLGPDDLIAVCGACYGRRRTLAAQHQQAAAQAALDAATQPLF